MATASIGTLLRHIHKLAARGSALQRTDRQLLDDFSARRDEAAFTAVVARHGPMVLRVCRRVLSHEQDAEDAFQATFLILAKKTASIRKREALAEWLHGVAYRTALELRRRSARRRDHEGRLWTLMSKAAVSPSWDDVQAVLDEEIQGLPEAFRSAFVLCILEGKTGAEAAAELGVKEGTVSSRLTRARQLLQRRLGRRGIKLSALLAALAIAESAVKAGMPAMLANVTVRSGLLVAAGGTAAGAIPSHVAALAAGVTRAMFLTKAKIAIAMLFAVGLFAAGAGVVTRQALAAKDTPPAAKKSESPAKEGSKPQAERAKAKDEKNDTIEVSGRVLDPEGKPVAGAKVYLLDQSPAQEPPKVRATTTTDGRFRFTVAQRNYVEPWKAVFVVATAEGYGPAVSNAGKPGKIEEQTLRLAKDDVPIKGRILDLQGKPVAGVTVRLAGSLYVPKKGDLAAWLKAIQASKVKPYKAGADHLTALSSPSLDALFPAITTGDDGRFGIKGLGRERIAGLRIEGPTIATREIRVMTRRAEGGTTARDEDLRGPVRNAASAAFDLVATPTKPIIGIVRDKDTGKPIPAAIIVGYRVDGNSSQYSFDSLVRTVADQDGRYRLVGLAKDKEYALRAAPPEGQPYVMSVCKVADTPGLEPLGADLQLQRGIAVSGRVLDKETGKPVLARIEYFVFADNANREPGWVSGFQRTGAVDGGFSLIALPGRSIVAARAWSDKYVLGVGSKKISSRGDDGHFQTLPYYCYEKNHHTLVELDLAKDAKDVTRDILLDPGRTVNGTIIGPDGKPLAGATLDWGNTTLKDAKFTVTSLGSEETRRLECIHKEKGLSGALLVKGDAKGPLTIKLDKWGVITGRLLDPDGQPLTDLRIIALMGPSADDPKVGGFVTVRPEKDGRFHIEGLAPGLKYNVAVVKQSYILQTSVPTKEMRINSGETKDLGDIQVKPME